MVTRLREEAVPEYLRVHADGFPGVRDLLVKVRGGWGGARAPTQPRGARAREGRPQRRPSSCTPLSQYNLHNFNIWTQRLGGVLYEILYHEYNGDDFEGDMAALEAEPRNVEWHKLCDPMQEHVAPGSGGALSGGSAWQAMERVFYNA